MEIRSVPAGPCAATGAGGGDAAASGGAPAARRAARALAPVLFGLAYLAAAELGHLLTAAGAPMATLWPPAGVHVAALLLAPARRWPTLALAAFAANLASDTLLHDRAPLVSLGFCLANGAAALLGAWLARRMAGPGAGAPPATAFHDRLRGAAALLAGAVLAGPALGATLGAGVVHAAFGAPYGQTWALWGIGDALGVLVVAPMVLGALGLPRPEAQALAERGAAALAAAALTASNLLLMPAPLHVPYLALPAMVWAALRGGSCGAAAALAGAAVVAAAAAALGAERFLSSPYGALTEVVRMLGFLAVAGATCHLLAAAAAEGAAARRRAEAAEARLRLAVEGAGMATFDTDHGMGRGVWSRGRFAMLGHAPPDGPEGEATAAMWRDRLHPEDRGAALARLDEARRTGRPYSAVHRVVRADDGRVRWVEAHGRFLDAEGGGPRSRDVGVAFDVTARVEAEERERLLLREVEHRAKNTLQVARSLLHATPFAGRDAFVAAVDARLGAMGRAHTLLSGARWSGADLREVAALELGPLLAGGGEGGAGAAPPRVALRGSARARLRPEAAQGLAMLLHELATNAAKHGALSAPGGRVEVSWAAAPGGGVSLRWSERGGPPAGAPPARAGFGSRLVAATARGQLGGSAEFRWRPEGLLVEVEVAADRLENGAARERGAGRAAPVPGRARVRQAPPPPDGRRDAAAAAAGVDARGAGASSTET